MNRALGSGQAKRWGVLGGTLAAVYGAYLGASALFGRDEEAEYLSASWLGKRGKGLEESLFNETEQFDARTMATIRGGTHFHEMIQELFEVEGAETEVKVVDESLGVKGYVDVIVWVNHSRPTLVKLTSICTVDRPNMGMSCISMVWISQDVRSSEWGTNQVG